MLAFALPMSDAARDHRARAPRTLTFASLTVSDSRTPADDASGAEIARLVVAAGHRLAEHRIVPDDEPEIVRAARELLARDEVDVVVTTGGTGFSPRDRTPEALAPLVEREVPGFGELFRALSYEQVGAAAMLSRALAGIVGGKALFVLPGSPKAVTLAVERLVLPEAAHLLSQARRR